jgi:hypothetical protein
MGYCVQPAICTNIYSIHQVQFFFLVSGWQFSDVVVSYNHDK